MCEYVLQWGCNREADPGGMAIMDAEHELLDLGTVVRREPLVCDEAFSGASLERVELAGGQRLVLKRLPPEGDWLTRATRGQGRARRLWEDGTLARAAEAVDHAVLDMVTDASGADVVVMEDVGRALLPRRGVVTRARSRRLLAGLAALHRVGESMEPAPLCGLAERYGIFDPAVHAADTGPGRNRQADLVPGAWALFAEAVPAVVRDTIFAVHADPGIVGRPLAAFRPTLLHGDVKPGNLGLRAGRVVAIDWGELTGFGPAEVDVGWYVLTGAERSDAPHEALFADYEAAAGRALDRRALDLVAIGSLAQFGCKFAGYAVVGETEDERAAAVRDLDWWVGRVEEALRRLGEL